MPNSNFSHNPTIAVVYLPVETERWWIMWKACQCCKRQFHLILNYAILWFTLLSTYIVWKRLNVCVEMVFMYKHDRPEMVNLDRKQMRCCCWFEKWTANVFDVVDSLPHVALSRKNNEHWEDIGLFVKICIFHVNWVETAEDNVEYNPTLSAYRMCLHGPAIKAVRTVCVNDDTETGHCFLSA